MNQRVKPLERILLPDVLYVSATQYAWRCLAMRARQKRTPGTLDDERKAACQSQASFAGLPIKPGQMSSMTNFERCFCLTNPYKRQIGRAQEIKHI